VALVLPDLLCELVKAELKIAACPEVSSVKRSKCRRSTPFGVVLIEKRNPEVGAELLATTRLDAVNVTAFELGIRAGQTLAEASTMAAGWAAYPLTRAQLRAALSRIAEVALAFGTPVSIEAPELFVCRTGYVPDTVWLDITGSAHLFGGEASLLAELESAVRSLGHVVRTAVSHGPWLAQALARWSLPSSSHGQSEIDCLRALPVAALPLDQECVAWLLKLGIFTLGELSALPRRAAVARLGEHAATMLELCAGVDPTPLVPYEPPRILVEELEFEHPLEGLEPLLFALRRLGACLAARLMGRGEAARELVLRLEHERAIVRLREVPAWAELKLELAEPIAQADELFRVVQARLERYQLLAPTVSLRLKVPVITRAPVRQLDLVRGPRRGSENSGLGGRGGRASDDAALPGLLGELLADLGPEGVGILRTLESHRPERQTTLESPLRAKHPRRTGHKPPPRSTSPPPGTPSPLPRGTTPPQTASLSRDTPSFSFRGTPTRLLPKPLALATALRVGAPLYLDHEVYTIEQLTFEERLEGVEWWRGNGTSRDYFRLWLRGSSGVIEALAFRDQRSGERFIQAFVD
jgi:protein ImuB